MINKRKYEIHTKSGKNSYLFFLQSDELQRNDLHKENFLGNEESFVGHFDVKSNDMEKLL